MKIINFLLYFFFCCATISMNFNSICIAVMAFLVADFLPFSWNFPSIFSTIKLSPHQDIFRGRGKLLSNGLFFSLSPISRNVYLWLFPELFVAISGRAFQTGPISVHYSAGVFFSACETESWLFLAHQLFTHRIEFKISKEKSSGKWNKSCVKFIGVSLLGGVVL